MDVSRFEALIRGTFANDNALRNDAEFQIEKFSDEYPEQALELYFELALRSSDRYVKLQSLVLARGHLGKRITRFSDNGLRYVMDSILKMINAMETEFLRKKVMDLVPLVVNMLGQEDTKDFLDTLIGWVVQRRDDDLSVGMYLLSQMFVFSPTMILRHIEEIVGLFTAFGTIMEVPEQARTGFAVTFCFLIAVLKEIEYPGKEAIVKLFVNITVGALDNLIRSGNDEDANVILQEMMTTVDNDIKMFKPYATDITRLCLDIAENFDYGSSLRHSAFELSSIFIIRLYSIVDPNLVVRAVQLAIGYISRVEEHEIRWPIKTSDTFNTEMEVGASVLDRISINIDPGVLLEVVFGSAPRLLASKNWKERFAGLKALSSIFEGCQEELLGRLNDIVRIVYSYLDDENAYVRFEAVNSIGFMSVDFSPLFQSIYHRDILPKLLDILSTAEGDMVPNVVSVISIFCYGMEDEIAEYSKKILSTFVELLSVETSTYSKEELISGIVTISRKDPAVISEHYNYLVSYLNKILESQPADKRDISENEKLKGIAIEGISTLGKAVGKEVFFRDAVALMEFMEKHFTSISSFYIVNSWAIIAQVLREDFVEFLPVVFPRILSAINQKLTFVKVSGYGDVNEDECEIFEIKGLKVALETEKLEEIRSSMRLLVMLTDTLGQHLANYLVDALHAVIPKFVFFYDDHVRSFACSAAVNLVRIGVGICERDQQFAANFRGLVKSVLLGLIEMLAYDEVASQISVGVESLELVLMSGIKDVDAEVVSALRNLFSVLLREASNRIRDIRANIEDDDINEDVESLLKEEELLVYLSRLFCAMLKIGALRGVGNYFESAVLPVIEGFDIGGSVLQTQAALYMITDYIHFHDNKEDALRLWNKTRGTVPNVLRVRNLELIQPSAYLFGVAAETFGSLLGAEEYVVQVCDLLVQLTDDAEIQRPEAREILDNVVLAISKVLANFEFSDNGTVKVLFRVLLVNSPLLADEEEFRVSDHLLLGHLERFGPGLVREVLGDGASRLEEVLGVVSERTADLADRCRKFFASL